MRFTFSIGLVLVFYILTPLAPASNNESICDEDLYGRHFQIDPEEYQNWPYAEKWHLEPELPTLKRFCVAAHETADMGQCKVNLVLYQMRWLSFVNTTHERRFIDLLEYGCQEGDEPAHIDDYWMITKDDRWYITQGTKPDCVFYLTRVNSSVEFLIDRHVCGTKINETYTLPEGGSVSEKL